MKETHEYDLRHLVLGVVDPYLMFTLPWSEFPPMLESITFYVDFEEYLLKSEDPTAFLLSFETFRANAIGSGLFRNLTIHILEHEGSSSAHRDFVEASMLEIEEGCKESGLTLSVERSRKSFVFILDDAVDNVELENQLWMNGYSVSHFVRS